MNGTGSDLFPEPYCKVRQIGQGTFGAVWLVSNRQANAKCVIKRIPLFEYPTEEQQRAEREVQLLQQLNHPNIVTYEDSFVHGGALNIVMEFCPAGDLHQLIDRHARARQAIAEDRIYEWLVQMVRALAHIHAHNIVHRDFKPANVLLAAGMQLKVADFGISKLMSATSQVAYTVIGTPAYFAPELCDNDPYDGKCDMWSLGVVLYELCALRLPFAGTNILALVRQITAEDPPPLPAQYQSRAFPLFVSLLLQKVAACRPSAQEFLEQYIEKGVFSAADTVRSAHDKLRKKEAGRLPRRSSKPPIILCPPALENVFREGPANGGDAEPPPTSSPAASKAALGPSSRRQAGKAKRKAAEGAAKPTVKGYAAQFRHRQAHQAKAKARTPHCCLERFLVQSGPNSPQCHGTPSKEGKTRRRTPKKTARPLQPPELQAASSSRSLLQSRPQIHNRKGREKTVPPKPPPCFPGLDPQLSAALEQCGEPLHRSMCMDNALFHSPLLRGAAEAPLLARCSSSPVLATTDSRSQSSLECTTEESSTEDVNEGQSSNADFGQPIETNVGGERAAEAQRPYKPHRLVDALWAAGEERVGPYVATRSEVQPPAAAAGAKASKAPRGKEVVPRPPAGLPFNVRPGGPPASANPATRSNGVSDPRPRPREEPRPPSPTSRSPRATRRGWHHSPRSPTVFRTPSLGPLPFAAGGTGGPEPSAVRPPPDTASPLKGKRRASSAKRKSRDILGLQAKANESPARNTARQRAPQPSKPSPAASTAFFRKIRSVKPTIDRNNLRRVRSAGAAGASEPEDAIIIGCVYLPRKLLDEAPRTIL
eukprot:GGOE01018364.1.p1 GENE.GGOE01018364.1~~GGOE01018364.1.p1  ORF type:complete len:823 (+),score=157.35 GGOE01018364.1:50-2518(+)